MSLVCMFARGTRSAPPAERAYSAYIHQRQASGLNGSEVDISDGHACQSATGSELSSHSLQTGKGAKLHSGEWREGECVVVSLSHSLRTWREACRTSLSDHKTVRLGSCMRARTKNTQKKERRKRCSLYTRDFGASPPRRAKTGPSSCVDGCRAHPAYQPCASVSRKQV